MNEFIRSIRKNKRRYVRELDRRKLEARAQDSSRPKNFLDIFKNRKNDIVLIAEIKFASPLEGVLHTSNDPVAIARDYLASDASAISVLTEENYFGGKLEYLSRVRAAFPDSYLLMKDFIFHEEQILEARILGANAVLIIASLLSTEELCRLYRFCKEAQVTPLVEVHSMEDLNRTKELEPELLLINNRDLQTLEVRLDQTRRILPHINDSTYVISASGFKNGTEIREFANMGCHGFLVGSALMKSESPGQALRKLLREHPDEN